MGKVIDFSVVLKESANLPMVRINRSDFLKTALSPYYDSQTVEMAIEYTPAQAGISTEEIKKIADNCINYETTKVSALSFLAGIPGGLAMIGSIPADMIQYFGHILRIVQKLIYLYGWKELFDENGQLDDGTANLLTLFIGVMFGANGATAAIAKIAEAMMQKASKTVAQKMLIKGLAYPVAKKTAMTLGAKLTKDVVAKSALKVVPIAGGVVSGALTYIMYKPMATKLRDYLSTLRFANISGD